MWNSIPVDSVGNCENVSGRNGTKDGVFGTVSRVRSDTSNGVILRKRERSREVRSYADVALGKTLGGHQSNGYS